MVTVAWQGEDDVEKQDGQASTTPASSMTGHSDEGPVKRKPLPLGVQAQDSLPGEEGNTSVFVASINKSFTAAKSFTMAASRAIQHAATGDDPEVSDKWAKATESSIVRPEPDEGQTPSWANRAWAEAFQEKRSIRLLLWYHFQTVCMCIMVATIIYPIVYAMSRITWHVTNDPEDGGSPYSPNRPALTWALLLEVAFPLILYAVTLYCCVKKSIRDIPKGFLIFIGADLGAATLVCGLFFHFKFEFWFWYLDLIVIALTYTPAMCMMGWYLAPTGITLFQRLLEAGFVALLEILVAVSTLVYCYFMMPLFFAFTSAWLQMLWLCVIHPVYFELTTGYIVRKALHRNKAHGRTDIVYFLTIVHAMVHTVAITTSLQASIEPIRVLTITVVLYNVNKLLWRSTVIQRDLLLERLFRWSWSYQYPEEERIDLAHMVTVGVLTEIILENASIIVAPFLMFCMYKEPLFMTVVPNTFFSNNGKYPVGTLVIVIAIMFVTTFLFDIAFFLLNYFSGQHLPIIHNWRRIKGAGIWYVGFLTYAFATMGVMFLFLTMLMLPRASYCTADDYCSCKTMAYEAMCRGESISTLVDYLV